MRPIRRALSAVAAALLAAVLPVAAATPAAAQPAGTVTWAVQPSDADGPDSRVSFRYELEPGDSVTDHVTVTNLSDHEVSFRLYASDGITTSAGLFDLLPASERPRDAGSWIELARSTIDLAPDQRRTVAFTLRVPADATPGDHPAGIVAAVTGAGTDELNVERRVGARVHLRVAGDLTPALVPSDPDADFVGGWSSDGKGTMHISYDVVNAGNVRLQGSTTVELRAPFGIWSRTFDLGQVPELLPGATFRVELTVEEVPALVMLTTTAQVVPRTVGADEVPVPLPDGQARERTWAMPWFWTLALLVIVAAVTAGALTRGRRRRRMAAALAQARADGRREAENSPAESPAAEDSPAGDGADRTGGGGSDPVTLRREG
ncbi:WxL protein peptidoglycan domain-containing protein [Solwaraspora sp. WMMB335]|uniref:WxL protein peptidoglycan domain-containing protein n=1 Tax=Solwaraspora sp. WMMB335 TaxID=3404118 RepID=UPI003B94192B